MGEHDSLVWFISWVFGHVASALAVFAALVGWLPPLAAMVALGWYLIQIYESNTVQGLLARRRRRRIADLEYRVRRLKQRHESRGPPA